MEFFEHIIDKYGFPTAVLVWMFWRDYKFLTLVSKKLQIIIDLFCLATAQLEEHKRAD